MTEEIVILACLILLIVLFFPQPKKEKQSSQKPPPKVDLMVERQKIQVMLDKVHAKPTVHTLTMEQQFLNWQLDNQNTQRQLMAQYPQLKTYFDNGYYFESFDPLIMRHPDHAIHNK